MDAFPKTQRDDHARTEEKYKKFRELVYETMLIKHPAIISKKINYRDCIAADKWEDLTSKEYRVHRGTWLLALEYKKYQNKQNRFEISLWADEVLAPYVTVLHHDMGRNFD